MRIIEPWIVMLIGWTIVLILLYWRSRTRKVRSKIREIQVCNRCGGKIPVEISTSGPYCVYCGQQLGMNPKY